jgi:hypothetical protein
MHCYLAASFCNAAFLLLKSLTATSNKLVAEYFNAMVMNCYAMTTNCYAMAEYFNAITTNCYSMA